jgi:hypothetical protein
MRKSGPPKNGPLSLVEAVFLVAVDLHQEAVMWRLFSVLLVMKPVRPLRDAPVASLLRASLFGRAPPARPQIAQLRRCRSSQVTLPKKLGNSLVAWLRFSAIPQIAPFEGSLLLAQSLCPACYFFSVSTISVMSRMSL